MIRLLYLAIFSISFATKAQGFLPPDHRSLPEAVKNSARSVVHILTKADPRSPITTYNLEKTAEQIDTSCDKSNLSFLQIKNCNALRACLSDGGIAGEDIPYLKATFYKEDQMYCFKPYNDGGSAFVVKNQSGKVKLLTNYHVVNQPNAVAIAFFKPAIKNYSPEKRVEMTKQLSFSFDLFGQNGEAIANINSNEMKLTNMGDIIGPETAATSGEKSIGQLLEDFAVIELSSKSLDLPVLSAASEPAYRNQDVFAIGFPVPSQNRALNSTGKSQWISLGKVLSQDDFFAKIQTATKGKQVSPEDLNEEPNYNLPSRGLVFSDADVISGMSGGPLVNTKGEVLGLMVKSFATPESNTTSAVITIVFEDLRF